ncbi:MAG: chemotaxis response regulator protein-glutamate methylesterase [Gammaproteobacteria bacterium]|nr:chemotaxis response regulator protein-glutamate methylesterase [Gammaproteobacteria bacterium]
MPINVLVVDDSPFFQRRLREMLGECADLNVVGVAANGREAVAMTKNLRPDVITMDYEMPVMDGVSAVRQIMAEQPTPILMFSSLTYEGARITLDALDAGAVDFLTKDFAEASAHAPTLKQTLHDRIMTICARQVRAPVAPARAVQPALLRDRVKLLLLGASTGGPVALSEVLAQLPENFPLPIVLVQHMPENFTRPFAERLDATARVRVREAQDGDILVAGTALLAPGGKQLMLDRLGRVRILPGDERVNYRPSLDITFGSAANAFADQVLAVVLTGMGSDGCEGARLIKQNGGFVWSQDQASCVVDGMPMAVARAGLTDRVLSLSDIGATLAREL